VTDKPRKATVTKPRFEQVMEAIMQVRKDEADAIMEAEKKPLNGKKRGRKAKASLG
jgi:hypothetical protein